MGAHLFVSIFNWVQFQWRPEEGTGSPELEIQVVVSYLTWVMGTKPRSSAEQSMFLPVEPSLQSHHLATLHPNLMALKSNGQGHICPWMLTVALFGSGSPSWLFITTSNLVTMRSGQGDWGHFLRIMEIKVRRVHWYLTLAFVPVSAVTFCSWLSQPYLIPPLAHPCLFFFWHTCIWKEFWINLFCQM